MSEVKTKSGLFVPRRFAEDAPRSTADRQAKLEQLQKSIMPRGIGMRVGEELTRYTDLWSGYTQMNPASYNQRISPSESNSLAHNIQYVRDQPLYDLMDEMVNKDLTICMTLQLVAASILERDMTFTTPDADDDDEGAAKMRSETERGLTNTESEFGWEAMLQNGVIGMLMHGFSVHEIIWQIKQGKRVPMAYLMCHPGQFGFDQYGNLLLSTDGGKNYIPVPENKFILMRSPALYSNPFGWPAIYNLRYFYSFAKDVLKSWMDGCDTYGLPVCVVQFEQDISQSEGAEMIMRKLEEALANLKEKTGIILPFGAAIEFMQRGVAGGQLPHAILLDWFERQKVRFLMGSTLMIMEGEHASRAQASTHGAMSQMKLKPLCNLVQGSVSRGAVNPYVVMNYNQPAGTMGFSIDSDDAIDVEQAIAVITAAAENGVPVEQEQFREWTGVNKPREGHDLIQRQSDKIFQYSLMLGVVTVNETRAQMGLKPIEGGDQPIDASRVQSAHATLGAPGSNEPGDPVPKKFTEKKKTFVDPAEHTYANKLEDVAAAAAEENHARLLKAVREAIGKMKTSTSDLDVPMPGIATRIPYLIANVDETSIERALVASRLLALCVSEKLFEDHLLKDFAEVSDLPSDYRDIAQWLLDKDIMTTDDLHLAAVASARAAGSTDVVFFETELRKEVIALKNAINEQVAQRFRDTIAAAVEQNRPMSDFVEATKELVDNDLLPSGMDGYLETVFRTETAGAYAQYREDRMNEPDMADYHWGWEVFNPNDRRSRPSHAKLDGLIIEKDSEEDRALGREPYNYNCRCKRAAVVVGDKSKPGIQPTEGAMQIIQQLTRFGDEEE
jgi:SPP1 gp7 family putative phage head morphogenesis protein